MRAILISLAAASLALLGACATEPEKPAAGAPVEGAKTAAKPQAVESKPVARVDVEVEVLLAAVGGLRLVAEHLELAAHARELVIEGFDLRRELDQRAAVRGAGERRLDFLQLLGDLALIFGELLPQQLDAPARLVVVEQALRRGIERHGAADEEREASEHQYSPL